MRVLWGLCALAAMLGAAVLALGVLAAKGAPQEAAAAAIGIGVAVIPYVFARSLAAMRVLDRSAVRDAVIEALRASREETLSRLKPPPGG